jgi:NDP-sugar pyrophosphorylase family protein
VRLVEPYRVGPGARVGDGATVGPLAVVGAGAEVEAGARIARAVVWSGARVSGEVERAIVTPRGVHPVPLDESAERSKKESAT